MKKKMFFIPQDEIIEFAQSAVKNQLKAVIADTHNNEVILTVEYEPHKQIETIMNLELSLVDGYSIDDNDD